MFDFIPLENYTSIYYYVLLIVVLSVFFKSKSVVINSKQNLQSKKNIAVVLLLFSIFYMGLRPISGRYFGDMGTYAQSFERFQMNEKVNFNGDVFFNVFMKFCSNIMTVHDFFLVCSLLYILPLWFACKKWFKEYSFYAFLILLISFSFWGYGVNGIRNGIATSLFLYGLSRDKLIYKIGVIFITIGVHKSLLIPATALAITYFYKDIKKYFYVWLLCIPISLISGSFWEVLFSSFMEDDRVSYLTEGNVNEDDFSSIGFRWDFLLYSAAAVYAAYFFIFKKNFRDEKYNVLVSIYLISNAFWILVIKANFSNRFAYLSWFMMGIIIVYPFITKIQFKNQHKVLGLVLLAYFGFTFLMNVLLV
ncbi:MAG TPA: EpsG family protein [Flavobacterium sp.]